MTKQELMIELIIDNLFDRLVCIHYQGDEEPCEKFDNEDERVFTCNCEGDIRKCEKIKE